MANSPNVSVWTDSASVPFVFGVGVDVAAVVSDVEVCVTDVEDSVVNWCTGESGVVSTELDLGASIYRNIGLSVIVGPGIVSGATWVGRVVGWACEAHVREMWLRS